MTTYDNNFTDSKRPAESDRTRRIVTAAPGRILGLSLILGVLADLLLFRKPLGLGFLLFVVMVSVTLWRLAALEQHRVQRQNLWLLLPLLFFAAMVAVRDNDVLRFLNVTAVLTLLAFLAFFWLSGRVAQLGLVDLLLLPPRVAAQSLGLSPAIVRSGMKHKLGGRTARGHLPALLRGLLLALPLLFTFAVLLAAADAIFAEILERFWDLDLFDALFSWLGHGLLIAVITVLLAGGFAYALWRRHAQTDQSVFDSALQRVPQTLSLGYVEAMTILSLVNILFFVFVTIQFTYLFGGSANIEIDGLTVADYARRGFFELLLVSLLSLGMIIGLNWLTYRGSKRHIRRFNALSSLLISFVLVMLVSAFRRMMLYEATFGYTFLRLSVYLIMIFLGATLIWFLITLWQRPERFAVGVFLCTIGFLISLNLVNPDAYVARQNVDRYVQTGQLDPAYLTTLSHDAVPQLLRVLPLTQRDAEEYITPACAEYQWQSEDYDCFASATTIIQNELHGRYEELDGGGSSWRAWQAFQVSRWSAALRLSLAANQWNLAQP